MRTAISILPQKKCNLKAKQEHQEQKCAMKHQILLEMIIMMTNATNNLTIKSKPAMSLLTSMTWISVQQTTQTPISVQSMATVIG